MMFSNPVTKFKNLTAKLANHHFRLRIVGIYNFINVLVYLILYPIVPVLLNYPPGMVGDAETFKMSAGISYEQTYFLFMVLFIIISTICLMRLLKGIDRWERSIKSGDENRINEIRRKCINIPFFIYVIQISIPILIMSLLEIALILMKKPAIATTIKVLIIIFSFQTLSAIIAQIFSKHLFKRLLTKSCQYETMAGLRISIKTKIFLQVLPMVVVALLFTSLVGYSKFIDEKGRLLFDIYRNQLAERFLTIRQVNSAQELDNVLTEIDYQHTKNCHFVIAPNGEIATSDGKQLDPKFLIYLRKKAPFFGGKVQESTGEMLGAIHEIQDDDGKWIVGVRFRVISNEMLTFFLWSFIALLGLNGLVLFYFSKSLAEDISQVAGSLKEIAAGHELDLSKKIPVTSNDEIGDLVIAFNKIQEREMENIKLIHEKQAILMEQERMASLGQLIGGIAHNLRTPIMSISGGIESLKELVKEYMESVADPNVTHDDHQEIGKEMLFWLENMKPHCTYMSDILTAVKGQTVQLNAAITQQFTVDELLKRIELLMNFELKKFGCILNTEVQVPLNQVIRGELSSLVQVMNNLIVNAIQAYGTTGGIIDLKISREPGKVIFIITDYGRGIPKEIQSRLFKEMVTTKGNQGTGLGLYMSYATVKGRFGGDLRFESDVDRGTIFYLQIPTAESE